MNIALHPWIPITGIIVTIVAGGFAFYFQLRYTIRHWNDFKDRQ
jgi:uncharacterized membrane-anchored protein